MGFHFARAKPRPILPAPKPFADVHARVRMGLMSAGVGSAIGGIGSIVGGLGGILGGNKAAKKAANIADSERRMDFYTGQVAREDQAPWRAGGNLALNQLTALLGLGYIPSDAYAHPSGTIRGNTDIFDQWIPKYGSGSGGVGPVGDGGAGTMGAGGIADRTAARDEAASLFATDPGYQFRQDEGNKAVEHSMAARGLGVSGPEMKALSRFNQGLAGDEYSNYINRLMSVAGFGPVANSATANAALGAQSLGQAAGLAGGNARASGYANQANQLGSMFGNLTGSLGRVNWNDLFSSGGAGSAAGGGWGGFEGGSNGYNF